MNTLIRTLLFLPSTSHHLIFDLLLIDIEVVVLSGEVEDGELGELVSLGPQGLPLLDDVFSGPQVKKM